MAALKRHSQLRL